MKKIFFLISIKKILLNLKAWHFNTRFPLTFYVFIYQLKKFENTKSQCFFYKHLKLEISQNSSKSQNFEFHFSLQSICTHFFHSSLSHTQARTQDTILSGSSYKNYLSNNNSFNDIDNKEHAVPAHSSFVFL